MSTKEPLIVVIDSEAERGQNLKGLIEFMDAAAVCVASPDDWLARIGERRLSAVFVDENLPKLELDQVIADVGDYDPNVSIVLVGGEPHA